ncbi:MAG TPA: hypothetical protein VJ553_06615, partial [Candidatus Paceibacterota bacterium]|nr:hypothetical protein [Candidatus Paceibacterota bacterium]
GFTSTTWSIPQTVLVKAAHDDVLEGERKVMVSHSLMIVSPNAADNAAFDGVAIPNVEVRVFDDDLGTLLIRQSDNSTRVLEGTTGAISDTYEVKLSVDPTEAVMVSFEFDALDQVQVFDLSSSTPDIPITSLTFGPGDNNWRTLTIKAVDDEVRENTNIVKITYTFVSADPVYDSALPVELDVRVFDNESAKVLVTESDGSTRVVMGGAGDDYTLRLVSDPGADVYVNLYGDGQTIFTGAQTVGIEEPDDRLVWRDLGDAQILTVDLATNGTAADTLTLTGMSWFDVGFSIGTLFTVDGGTTLKVNNITDTWDGDTLVSSTLTLTSDGAVADSAATMVTLQRKTWAVMFDSSNWSQE